MSSDNIMQNLFKKKQIIKLIILQENYLNEKESNKLLKEKMQNKKINEFIKAELENKLQNLTATMCNLWNYWLKDVKRIPDIQSSLR